MIVYDTKRWWSTLYKLLIGVNLSHNSRMLFRGILLVTLYTLLVVFAKQHYFPKDKIIETPLIFTILGLILGLILVFRLNTAYNKWWEGRMKWGALVNDSRTLASYLHTLLPTDDKETRSYYAAQISNFAIALRGHLRDDIKYDEFEHNDPNYIQSLKEAPHVPHKIATLLMEWMQTSFKRNYISGFDKINIKVQIQNFIDILGACERIKNTPIPFSHSSFIKAFITVYVITLPFGIIDSFHEIYFAITATVLISYALIGVEIISEEIEDPFGNEANDLPLTHLSNIIKKNVYDALEVTYEKEISPVKLEDKLIKVLN
ncbi:MAG TPA: hypothetical protein DCS93_00045 [Microscillaceae bacterium]|nr:hypothetical protein [Microscillaceae bacterium]